MVSRCISLQYAVEQIDKEDEERFPLIEAHFRERLSHNTLRGEYYAEAGAVSLVIARRLRTADLAIIGQPDPDAKLPVSTRYLLEDVLLASGRPVLAIPYAGRCDPVGKDVLIAWNGSREAARATSDALSLINPAASVTILTVQEPGFAEAGESLAAGAANHLDRHGLKATVVPIVADKNIAAGDAILRYAADIGADLIVAGCCGGTDPRWGYSHSAAADDRSCPHVPLKEPTS